MTTNSHATYFPRRANCRVNNLAFASEVDTTGLCRAEIGVLPAASANAIMNAVSLAAAVVKGGQVAPTFNADTMMGLYGRNVTVSLSGAGTPTVTVRGRDYLGQPVTENIVAAGAGVIAGKKAFKSVDNIDCALTAATTLNLGTGNVLGLPYAFIKIDTELVNNTIAAAGTFVPALSPQTITSTDPRGTYTPAAGVVPDGSREIIVSGYVLNGQLHGVPHFYS